jgi:YD repeat-containing protein
MLAIAGIGAGMSLASSVLSTMGGKGGAHAASGSGSAGGAGQSTATGDTTATVTNPDGSVTTTVTDASGRIISISTTQPSETTRRAEGNNANVNPGAGTLDIRA